MGGSPPLRWIRAGNPGPFTLDGTRTYLVGTEEVAVVDPGPDDPRHLEALERALAGSRRVTLLVTHGHPDHAGGAAALAGRTGAVLLGAGVAPARFPSPGETIPTDAGDLEPVATPGHTSDHLSFHWPERRALFCGDLLLGEGDTTWLGEYPGCVADYFASLERVAHLAPDVVYPTHGPPIEAVAGTLARYRRHREERLRQVGDVRAREPDATPGRIVEAVYGARLPEGLRPAALRSVEAMLHHLEGEGG